MGLGRFFGSSTSSSSSSRSPQPRGRNPPPMGPGSSKLDYARGLDSPTSPSTSLGLAHSYYHDDDAPPAYSPQKSSDFHDYATDTKMSTPGKTNTNAAHFSVPAPVDPGPIDSRGESPLKALSNRDIVVLLDDSGSMLIVDPVANRTRWDQAWDALRTLVDVGIAYDREGIDINFMNQKEKNRTVKNVRELDALRGKVLEPSRNAPTPTAEELERLLIQYRKLLGNGKGMKEVKKRVFLVITDGAATDAPDEVIIREAKLYHKRDLPSDQVGIQFIQVGNDAEATEFLEQLDNQLEGRMGEYSMDIVDTVKSNGRDLTGDTLIKALTGGFNRRQDRMQERLRAIKH